MRRRALLAAAGGAVLAGCATTPAAGDLLPLLRCADVVLLGEVHDNAMQHRSRARALRQWIEGGARPVLLMEHFDRERQADLDRARAQAGADAKAVVRVAGGAGWQWEFYEPYVALALEFGLPLVAANVSRTDTRSIVRDGLAAHGFDAAVPADVQAAQVRAIVDSHCGMVDEAQAQTLARAQVARDQFMARSIVAAAATARPAVLLAGNGHVRSDAGVPRWLDAAVRTRTLAVGWVEEGGAEDSGAVRFDVVLKSPRQPREDPCAALRKRAPPSIRTP